MVGPKNLVDPNGGSTKVHETQKFNEKWSPKPAFFNTFFFQKINQLHRETTKGHLLYS